MSARMEKYPSAAAVTSSRSQTAQGEPLCPHGSSSAGSWLAAEKGWSRRKGTASCSNTKAGKTGSLAFSACRAGWRPSPHKGSIRRTPAPRRFAVLEPSKAADCGGNARSNPSGKAAVSVGVQAPAWTFFKGSQLSVICLSVRSSPTLRGIAKPASAHFPSTLETLSVQSGPFSLRGDVLWRPKLLL